MNRNIKLALINLKNEKRMTFPVIVAVSTALFLLTLTLVNGFVRISNNYKTDDIALREISFFTIDSNEHEDEMLREISGFPHVEQAFQKFDVFLKNTYHISIGTNKLNCSPSLTGVNRNFSFCSKKMAYQRTGNADTDPIIAGRVFNRDDLRKAIIDENTCYILGVKDVSKIIGEKISIELSDISIENIEIVGVCAKEFGDYYCDLSNVDSDSAKGYLESTLMNPLYFSDDIMLEIVLSSDIEESLYENLIVCADNTDYVSIICDKAEDLFGYVNESMVAAIEKKAQNIRNSCLLIYLISGMILFVSLIGMINSLYIKIDKQKRFTEMILKIGFRKKDICIAYVIENMIVLVKAELKAIVVVLVFSIGFDIYMSQGYKDIVNGAKYLFWPKAGELLSFVGLTFLFIIGSVIGVSIVQVGKIVGRMEQA